jgi:hypothetical protein
MAGPCFEDTNCIDLSEVDGKLQAAPKISPDSCNTLECRPNGMYVPHSVNRVTAAQIGGAGITVSLAALGNDVPTVVFITGTITSNNPSPCFQSGLIWFFTPREIQYTGAAGDRYLASWFASINGGPFGPSALSSIRPTHVATGVPETHGMSGGTRADVIPAGGNFFFQLQLVITRLAPYGTGTLVTPGGTVAMQHGAPTV